MKIFKHLRTRRIYGQVDGKTYVFIGDGEWSPSICIPPGNALKELSPITWGTLHESLRQWVTR